MNNAEIHQKEETYAAGIISDYPHSLEWEAEFDGEEWNVTFQNLRDDEDETVATERVLDALNA